MVTFVCWAWWATLDDVTRGEGRVVPAGRLQSIQNLEGGLLSRLLVAEDDEVSVGQTLMLLDDTRYRTPRPFSANVKIRRRKASLGEKAT